MFSKIENTQVCTLFSAAKTVKNKVKLRARRALFFTIAVGTIGLKSLLYLEKILHRSTYSQSINTRLGGSIKMEERTMIEQRTCVAPILTVKDVQQILRIGQVSAYALVRSNVFPVVRIGRSYRIPQDTFMEWVRKMDAPATATSIAIADTACILTKLKNGGISYGNQKF